MMTAHINLFQPPLGRRSGMPRGERFVDQWRVAAGIPRW